MAFETFENALFLQAICRDMICDCNSLQTGEELYACSIEDSVEGGEPYCATAVDGEGKATETAVCIRIGNMQHDLHMHSIRCQNVTGYLQNHPFLLQRIASGLQLMAMTARHSPIT